LLSIGAAVAQDKGGEKGKGGGRAPQNLKVLKLEPGANIGQIMRTYTTGLGVQCNFCHVQGNCASDDNPKKDVARKMIQVVDHANATISADGKAVVTCYTCHRGEEHPKSAAPAAQ